MTDHEYLSALLDSHALADDGPEVKAMRLERTAIETVLRAAYPGADLTVLYGGSYKKKTMVRDSYDLDILAYFAADESAAGLTLESIYDSVKAALSDTYRVTPKRSALRLESKAVGHAYTHVDVVPGRYVDDDKEDVFLHQSEGDKVRLKTNLSTHIAHVRDSGRRPVIKLVKIWKKLAGLEIPTFILELLVIVMLDGEGTADHGVALSRFFAEAAANLDEHKIADPANSNNDLYAIFTPAKQTALKDAAQAALDAHEAGGFVAVFGETFEDTEEDAAKVAGSTALAHPYVRYPLADIAHRQAPSWPPVNTLSEATLTCTATFQGRSRLIRSESTVQVGAAFRYRVRTSVQAPYEVQWQVVNTGEDARQCGGLRGNFFLAHGLEGGGSADPHVNEEKAGYVGKHWIEAFIVKDGLIAARSGRFYVNIWRPPQRRVPFLRR
ncbi:MAG: hypothetical protein IV100_25400 [Myxococcales bacterium]|nr:hypothetical protein [Myxococcales bacterium]